MSGGASPQRGLGVAPRSGSRIYCYNCQTWSLLLKLEVVWLPRLPCFSSHALAHPCINTTPPIFEARGMPLPTLVSLQHLPALWLEICLCPPLYQCNTSHFEARGMPLPALVSLQHLPLCGAGYDLDRPFIISLQHLALRR